MKIFYIIIIFFLVLFSNAQNINLNEIRVSYLAASDSEENIEKLVKLCENYNDKNSSIVFAYKTVAEMMIIRYRYSPLKKLEIFNNKSKFLDLIIEQNKNNIEIRFLRYCIQRESPMFLGYNKELDLDYTFILRNIHKHPKETKDYIYSTIKSL